MDDVLKEFLAEATESIEALDSGLVRFERHPDDPALLAEIFRVMHTIKGTCGFLCLPRLEKLAHAAENVLGGMRDGSLSPSPASVGPVLETIDAIKNLLTGLGQTGEEPAGADDVLLAKLRLVAAGEAPAAGSSVAPQRLPSLPELGGLATLDAAVEGVVNDDASRALWGAHTLIEERDDLQAGLRDALAALLGAGDGSFEISVSPFLHAAPDAAIIGALSARIEAGLAELDVEPSQCAAIAVAARSSWLPVSSVELPTAAAPMVSAQIPSPSTEHLAAAAAAPQSIRVSLDSIEQLMNVVSELVLIRNQLLQTSRQNPDSAFSGPLQRLNHVTTELQESVMTTRMQPIGHAWSKLPRLVRDISADLGKKIELEMAGAETELDRQVLELIKDPLTHMIRNAVDHGIERVEDRLASGKSETGHIYLSARHEGGHIIVEVADDGRGLSLSSLRRKAVERGLMSQADAASAADSVIEQLIFNPGFSTATKVTNISGRGVGMDVVRTNIEKINGSIELSSREGAGTRFTIRIPLTLTIVSALIVETAGKRFAMPQSSVVELVGTNASSRHEIEYLNGSPVLRLRDRLLPLVSLQSLLHLEPQGEASTEPCIMVTQIGSFSFGIIVDRVFDTEEIVVKPVARVLKHIPLYSGNTILGDGTVIMILDPQGIAAETGRIEAEDREAVFFAQSAQENSKVPILVVGCGTNSWKAVPLSLVARIEELEPSRVESVDGRRVIQYRNHLVPVITVEGTPIEFADNRPKPVLIFEDQGRDFALVVDEVLDIVEQSLETELISTVPGRLGSLIVSGRAADLLDVGYYWTIVANRDESGDLSLGKERPRVLLVEPSPFFRNLLHPLLASAGYQVTFAASVREAHAAIAACSTFDLILSDTDAIKGRDLTPAGVLRSIPVVGLTTPGGANEQGDDESIFASFASKHDRREILRAMRTASAPVRRAA